MTVVDDGEFRYVSVVGREVKHGKLCAVAGPRQVRHATESIATTKLLAWHYGRPQMISTRTQTYQHAVQDLK